MKVFRRFIKGILLKGESSDPSDNQEGSIWVNSSDSKLKSYLGAAIRSMVSEDQTQTLTNKTIDSADNTITIDADEATVSELETDNLKSGVLNTSTTLTGASDTQIPSALATKTYVDDSIATKDEASEISYDNTTSGLAATDVQAATDEVEGRVDTLETDISGKADTDLNNLASVDLNQNLTTTKASALQLSHTTVNQDVDVLTANNGAGDSGDINLTPGTATGTRGDINLLGEQKSTVNINSPIWWATSGIPGITLDLTTTAATNAFAAAIVAEGSVNDADFFIQTQDQDAGTAGSANMYITTGWNSNTGSTGNLELYTGNQSGASGNTGAFSFETGQSSNGNSGSVNTKTGQANNGTSGSYSISTGNSTAGTTGNIDITTGTTSGTRGEINLSTSKVDMTSGTELDVTGITITGLAGSSVANTPSGNLAATDVQAALNELQSDIDTRATATALNDHLDGGVSKHDATEIDYERLDGSKKNIQAASDDAEAALTDLDDAIGALDATPTNYTPTSAAIVADHLSAIDTALAGAGGGGATTELDNLGTTAINADLNFAASNTLVLKNNVFLKSRNAADSADTNLIRLNTSNEIEINGTIVGTGLSFLGTVSKPIGNIGAGVIRAYDNSTQQGQISGSDAGFTTPSGRTSNFVILNGGGDTNTFIGSFASGSVTTGAVYIETGDASGTNDTGEITLITGDKSSASSTPNKVTGDVTIATGDNSGTATTSNSGNITLTTGTVASGVRGGVVIDANKLDASSVSEGVGLPVWKKITIGHAALQAAALTNDIELLSLPAGACIHAVTIKHTTAFAGTGITAYSASIGISGTLDKYASAFDILQATGDTVAQATNVFDVENFGSATSIRIAATSVGANLDQSSAGSVDVYVLMSTLPV